MAPTEGEMRVEKIVISGGTALLKNIDRFFSRELNMPVEINDPFLGIGTKGVSGGWEEFAPMFAVATGLALRVEGDLKK